LAMRDSVALEIGALVAQLVPVAGLAALLAERPALLHVLEAGVLLGSVLR